MSSLKIIWFVLQQPSQKAVVITVVEIKRYGCCTYFGSCNFLYIIKTCKYARTHIHVYTLGNINFIKIMLKKQTRPIHFPESGNNTEEKGS